MTNSLALIPVFTGTINSQSIQLCDARTLHTFMVVLRDFSNWIKGRIRKFGFVEGVDFISVKNLSSPDLASAKSRAQTLTDYHLTLDMAKELAMVENNAKGREARRYFIDCEKKALAAPAAPYSIAPDQTLSAEQADTLRNLLGDFATSMPLDLRGLILREGWSKLKSHFKTDYRHISQGDFNEAISIVSRHIAGWAPCDPRKKEFTPAEDKPKFSLLQKRWLVYFDCNGVECAKLVPTDAMVLVLDDLPRLIRQHADPVFASELVAEIAHACANRQSAELAEYKKHSQWLSKKLAAASQNALHSSSGIGQS